MVPALSGADLGLIGWAPLSRTSDVLVGCETLEDIKVLGKVVGRDEVGEMASKLVSRAKIWL